ncbi:hypothetical protein acsn021_34010 [Anaerocolumna cellulosilytica]|uniref:Uncharacterized protein n=1 Tax=Anaerocolumna cellulosilytica TaxID=433286 RepID=A0A6S6R998_9FIRM|nr:AraC family transcriptional regulator [Anaerocolumna cellulosilytica]MBB5196773.1 AraC-like DNA-binding protein [Anaerocolumna cellulosilytica]BCJ95832.1 hypothetical protein acsn021_34010 [Anaerocolumna cellulosilytica]
MSTLVSLFETMEYINENIAEDVTVNQCSENAELSTQIFIEQFKQYMGYSPYRYIKELRFELAAKVFGDQSQTTFTNTLLQKIELTIPEEKGVPKAEFQKKDISCIEDLNEIEKMVVFLSMAEQEEGLKKIYYSEHKKIYDSLIKKGFIYKNTLEYQKERKELVKKYFEDYSTLISEAMKVCTELSEVYLKVFKNKSLPIILFYSFVRAMAVKGELKNTVFSKYKECADCKFLTATLGDVRIIREQIIQEYKEKGIIISGNEIFCLGNGSGRCTEYCPAGLNVNAKNV